MGTILVPLFAHYRPQRTWSRRPMPEAYSKHELFGCEARVAAVDIGEREEAGQRLRCFMLSG
jgi:hypothetical protein